MQHTFKQSNQAQQEAQTPYLFSEGKIERQLYICKGEQGFRLSPCPGEAIQEDALLAFACAFAQSLLQQLQDKNIL